MPFDAAIVAEHAAAIANGRWFSLVGLPFSTSEKDALRALAPRVDRVRTWDEARRTADDPRANAAYDADVAEVDALKARALAGVAPDALLRTMSEIVDRGLEIFFDAAAEAARRAGVDDETTIRVAAGSAAEAVYRGALAAAIDGTEHRFARIEELFVAGRWPLARIRDTLYVF